MRSKPRLLVLPLSLAAHLALLGVFALAPPPPPTAAAAGALYISLQDGLAVAPPRAVAPLSLTPVEVLDVLPDLKIAPAAPSALAPILIALDLPDTPPQPDTESERPSVEQPLAASATRAAAVGESCQLTQWIQGALREDATVRAALSAIPREARSLANAIMLWDGRWVESASMSARQSAPIREAIILGVRTAPAACRDETLRGPLLIAVPDRFGTTLLAVGSGVWKWSDLLPEAGAPGA
ncbi:hypothetical protein [Phenylobacterium sp.]|uniref:hypothetical protein n=1 Tax=Phenylobacterium sp. TaxID=1871053 RepID=UPI00286C73C4|nr:hypothetical protein [Phenylobacterium sp.]